MKRASLDAKKAIGFYATGSRPETFSRSPSGYMDDDLRLDYIVKYSNVHTTPSTPPGACVLWMGIAVMVSLGTGI